MKNSGTNGAQSHSPGRMAGAADDSPHITERGAWAALVAGATMISFSSVLVKLADVTPTVSAFYRVAFGALFLGGAAVYKGLSWRAGGRIYGLLALCGLVFALNLYFWHVSIHYVGPGLATLLSNFQVFFLGVVGVAVMGEPLGWRLLLAVPLAVMGLFMIVGIQWDLLGPIYRLGVWFGIIGALFYSAYLLALRKAHSSEQGLHPLVGLSVICFITAFCLGMNIWAVGDSFAIPNGRSWGALVGLGLFSQTVGWLLITRGLPHIRASLAGLCLMIQPTLAFVWDILFFQRPTSYVNLAGVVLTLGAIYLGSTSRASQ